MEGVRNILCSRVFVEANEVGHFREPVSDYHSLGLTLRFR